MQSPPQLGLGSLVTRGEVVFRSVAGETVLLDPRSTQCFALDAVGSRVWELLATPRRVEELCAAIGEEFEVEPEACQRDVLSFLEKLLAASIVRVSL